MPLDARIPLAVGTVPMPDFLGRQGQAVRLHETIRLADDRQQERDRLAEERERVQSLKAAYVYNPDDFTVQRPATLRNLFRLDPNIAYEQKQAWQEGDRAIREQEFNVQKAATLAKNAELAQTAAMMEQSEQLALKVTDTRSFRMMFEQLRDMFSPEEIEKYAAADYTPESRAWLQGKIQEARAARMAITQQQSRLALEDEARARSYEQWERDIEIASNLADTITDQRQLNNLHAQTGGRLIPHIGDVFNFDTQDKLASLGITAQEQATGAAAAETRTETKRHNQAMEAAARDRAKESGGVDRQKEIDSLRGEAKEIARKLDEVHARRTLLGKGLETGTYYPKGSGKPEKFDATTFWHGKDSDPAKAVKAEIEALKTEAAMLTKRRDTKIREIRRFEGDPTPAGAPAGTATPTGKPIRQVDAATGKEIKAQRVTQKQFLEHAARKGLSKAETMRALNMARKLGRIKPG